MKNRLIMPEGPDEMYMAVDEMVRVTVQESENYRFLGWYPVTTVSEGIVKGYDADHRLSEELSYSFRMTDEISIVAVFKEKSPVDPSDSVDTPSFSPPAGTYTGAQNVTLFCETEGADIYYTTDGSEPSESSIKYRGAIPVTETLTIKAIAIREGVKSATAIAKFIIEKRSKPSTPSYVIPVTGIE